MTSRRAARLRVDPEILKHMLRLPDGWAIRHIRLDTEAYDDALVFVVEGPDLPPVEAGITLPFLWPIYHRHPDGTVTATFEAPK